jgi:hypothetical protein
MPPSRTTSAEYRVYGSTPGVLATTHHPTTGASVDPQLARVLDDLYQEGRAHDGPLADRLLRRRNMTPEAAQLIALLIRVQRAGSVLEIGTSNGYSAIWFADAVRDTGGLLTTVEIDENRVAATLRTWSVPGPRPRRGGARRRCRCPGQGARRLGRPGRARSTPSGPPTWSTGHSCVGY